MGSTSTDNPDRLPARSLSAALQLLQEDVQSLEDSVHNSTENPDGMAGHHSNATLKSSTTICDTDFRLAAEEDIIKIDSQVRMSPWQRMNLFAITHGDMMRICSELDGSDERTNELEGLSQMQWPSSGSIKVVRCRLRHLLMRSMPR